MFSSPDLPSLSDTELAEANIEITNLLNKIQQEIYQRALQRISTLQDEIIEIKADYIHLRARVEGRVSTEPWDAWSDENSEVHHTLPSPSVASSDVNPDPVTSIHQPTNTHNSPFPVVSSDVPSVQNTSASQNRRSTRIRSRASTGTNPPSSK